ncbi:hypothetical protein V3C99_018050 [Haemonchus contortus]
MRVRELAKKTSNSYNSTKGPVTCIFCNNNGHKSLECQKFSTIEKRKLALREQNRCFNCSLPGHFTQDCTKNGCKFCNGSKHHYTLCPQRNHQERTAEARFVTPTASTPPKGTSTPRGPHKGEKRQQQQKSTKVQAHTVDTGRDQSFSPELPCGNENPMGTVLPTVKSDPISPWKIDRKAEQRTVLLLTGVAKVKDTYRDQWKDVEILLDTGADQSFISNDLARELGIKSEYQTKLTVYTFGSDKPRRTMCEWTNLDVWDQKGVKHSLRLLTTPILTTQQKSAQLNEEDLAFVAQHKIILSKPLDMKKSMPQILIGCDQLWDLLDVPSPRYKLPSGLQLLPSKLGYLLTGQQSYKVSKNEPTKTCKNSVAVMNSITEFDEELEQWDKYWRIDSAGMDELQGQSMQKRKLLTKR